MSPEEIVEITELVKKYLPVIKELGSELIPLTESFFDYIVDLNLRMIARYEKAGLEHREAVMLVLSNRVALQDAVNNYNNQKKVN